MKVGLMVPNFGRWFRGEGIWATCEKAKELDLDALCFVDHVIVEPHQVPGMGNGFMDIWTAMSYVAAVTNAQGWKPILTQAVCVIPYRPPIQQAKVAATVDSLSGGRLMLGVGSGYHEAEFAALGLEVRERGDLTDDYLACMKELWTHPVTTYHGKYASFDEMTISVRPTQQPYPPILYGSHGARPRRRIAERYQGNIQPPGRDVESQRAFESDMADLDKLWKEYGRSGKPYLMAHHSAHLTANRTQVGQSVVKGIVPEGDYVSGTGVRAQPGQTRAYGGTRTVVHVSQMVEDMRRLESAGVDLAIAWLPSYRYGGLDNLGMQLQQMELFAEHVLPKISRDKDPIEFDYDGKRFSPLAIS